MRGEIQMETNTGYYNNLHETEDKRKYQTFGDMRINTQFDITAQYALQGGNNAPLASIGVIYGGRDSYTFMDSEYSIDYSTINHDESDPVTGLFLLANGAHGWYTFEPTIPCEVQGQTRIELATICQRHKDGTNNELWWSPYAANTPLPYYPETAGIVTDFRYAELVMLVGVFGYNEDFTSSSSAYLDAYDFDQYPNITELSYNLFYINADGTERTERYMSIGRTYSKAIKVLSVGTGINLSEGYKVKDVTKNFTVGYNLFGWNSSLFNLPTALNSRSYGRLVPLYKKLQKKFQSPISSGGHTYYVPMTKDDAETVASTFGLYWTGTPSVAVSGVTGSNATSDLMRLPVAENGIYRGKFVRGADIKTAPNADWGKDPEHPYDWKDNNGVTPDPDTNNYTDKTPLSTPKITAFGAFNRAYAMTQSGLNDLANFLWNTNDSVFEGIVDGLKLMGENPMNGIIDCRMYPFNVLDLLSNTGSQQITLGRTQTNIVGVHLGNTTNCILDLGSCVWRKYHSRELGKDVFLDSSPYTTGELYIPYVGTIPLDSSIYAGHIVSVYLIVDFMTGACEAVVYRDGLATDFKSGVIGVDVPVTGGNAAQWANGVVSAALSGANGVASIATGNPVGGVLQTVGAIQSGFNNPYNPAQKGSASSSCGQWLPQHAYLLIHSPIRQVPPSYGSTIGYACEYTSTLGSNSGYTVCADVNINNNFATENERKEIEDLLKGGIFV